MELLGSTETTGPQSACLPGAGTRPASVGRSFPQVETRISCPGGDGKERGAMDLFYRVSINCHKLISHLGGKYHLGNFELQMSTNLSIAC